MAVVCPQCLEMFGDGTQQCPRCGGDLAAGRRDAASTPGARSPAEMESVGPDGLGSPPSEPEPRPTAPVVSGSSMSLAAELASAAAELAAAEAAGQADAGGGGTSSNGTNGSGPLVATSDGAAPLSATAPLSVSALAAAPAAAPRGAGLPGLPVTARLSSSPTLVQTGYPVPGRRPSSNRSRRRQPKLGARGDSQIGIWVMMSVVIVLMIVGMVYLSTSAIA
jgi:hypothetical protein